MGHRGGHVQSATKAVGVLVNCAILSTLFAVNTAPSSSAQVIEPSDKTYAICAKRCAAGSTDEERQTLETCMLRCRNYVEQTMFRPRIQTPSRSNDLKAVFDAGRYARAIGPRNHMFVRVGKSIDSESDDEEAMKRSGAMQMRGSFVRIGRLQMSPLSDAGSQASDSEVENDDDVTKRRTAGFVRIGRRGPSQQFVRIGRDAVVDSLDDGEEDDVQEAMDKRAKGQAAFVRIGRKSSNFVRIGKAFVRIGKNDAGASSSAIPDAETANVMETSDEA